MRPAQRAAHRRPGSDGAIAARPRRRGRWHRDEHAANPVPRGNEGHAGPVAGRAIARIGPAAWPAARTTRTRAHRAAWRRLPGAPHDRHAPGSAAGHGRPRAGRARPRARGARRPEGRLHVSRGSISHGHRDSAPRRGLRRRAQRDPSRRDRTARRRAVPLPGRDGRRHRRRRHLHDPRARRVEAPRRNAHAVGRLHRRWQLGRHRRDHRRHGRDPRRARRRRRSGGRRAAPAWGAVHVRRDAAARGAVEAQIRRAHHDRPLARLPQ